MDTASSHTKENDKKISNRFKKSSLFFILIMSFFQMAHSADWQRINIGGGGAMNVVGAGVDGTLIAGTDLAGAYIKRPTDTKWQMLGPLNGLFDTHVTGVIFDQANANFIVLATEGGLYRSANKGNSFTRVDRNTESSEQYHGGKYLTLARKGSRVYASRISEYDLSDGKVLISRNGGKSFRFTAGALPRPNRSVITKLIIHPSNPDVVLALSNEERFDDERADREPSLITHKALYMSINGGDLWVEVAQNISNITDVVFHPADADRIYISNTASDDSANVFRCVLNVTSTSCNNALNPIFSHSGDGPPLLMLWPDKTNANVVRAININTAWSHYDPAGWKLALQNGTWGHPTFGKTSDWAGTNDDWKLGWSKKNGILNPTLASINHTLGFDLSNPNRILWATDQFVHRGTLSGNTLNFENLTTTGGDTTGWASQGLDNITPFILDINTADPNVIYAGLNDLGCTVSRDAGASWNLCINNSTSWLEGFNFTKSYGGTVTALISDPASAANVWMFSAGDQNEPVTLQFSDDYGKTWSLRHGGWNTTDVYGLSMGGSGLFVTVDGAVYRSTDSGASWDNVFSCGSVNNGGCRTVKVGKNGLVYAGGEAGFFVSKNNGNASTWETVLSKNKIKGHLALDGDVFEQGEWRGISGIALSATNDPNHVYVAAFSETPAQGIYKCDISGSGSTRVDQCDLKLSNKSYIRDIAVDPNNALNLYATSSSAYTSGGFEKDKSVGVLRSVDGGKIWTPLNKGLDWEMAIPIQVHPTDSNIVFVGSPGGGNYKIDLSTFSILTKPQLLSPLGTTSTNPPVFKWNKVAGAISYKLFVNEYAEPNIPGKIDQIFTAAEAGCTTNPVCEVSPDVSFKIVAGEWWVTANKGETSTLSDSGSFTIVVPETSNENNSDTDNDNDNENSNNDKTKTNTTSGGGLIALKWLFLLGFINVLRRKYQSNLE